MDEANVHFGVVDEFLASGLTLKAGLALPRKKSKNSPIFTENKKATKPHSLASIKNVMTVSTLVASLAGLERLHTSALTIVYCGH